MTARQTQAGHTGRTRHNRMADSSIPANDFGAPGRSVSASRLPGFYNLPLEQRRQLLVQRFGFTDADLRALDAAGGLQPHNADRMVENAVGVFALPLGIAANFLVDDEAVIVPMAVEEPSV